MSNRCVKLVVLGDIGRSPRMQYHSKSFAALGHHVDIIGYAETSPPDSIKHDPSIFTHYLCPVPRFIPITFLNFAFKALFQALNLLWLLVITSTSSVIIVQNPPAIPSLFVCWLYARIVRAKLFIDWHNYAHTIMAMNVHSVRNPLVWVTRMVEKFVGRCADFNICVTEAMKKDLKDNWNIKAHTLYDRPAEIFRPISVKQRDEFLNKLFAKYRIEADVQKDGIIVSSTSWTEDEDFSILISALQNAILGVQYPNLVCFVTGKGPLKEYYIKKIATLKWNRVKIYTPWLEIEEYPLLLASANLGVSLHVSSSGFDLPMKVVDMFGCGLPVAAINFKCLNELVKDDVNSFVFETHFELSTIIVNWFNNFPNNKKQQQIELRFKREIETFQCLRWHENWIKSFRDLLSQNKIF